MIKRLLSYLLLTVTFLFYGIVSAYAIAPVEADGTTTIVAGANTIQLNSSSATASYSHIIVWTSSTATTIYVTFNQGATASASNAALYGGASLSFGLPGFSAATTQINYFSGASPTGSISWMAW